MNAYTLTFAVFLLTGAALGDRFGRRRMFIRARPVHRRVRRSGTGAAMEALIAARAVQGIGGAIVTPLTLTILSAAFPAEKRGVALGAWSGSPASQSRRAPRRRRRRRRDRVAVDLLAERPDRTGSAPAGADARRVHGPDRRSISPVSRSPAAACSVSSGASSTALGRLEQPEIVASLAVGAVLLAAFVAWEARRRSRCCRCASSRQGVLGRERRLARDVLRHVRLDLPALPVLPDRAGLPALRVGSAGAAVDGDADDRRADRRCALRPDRRPALPAGGLALQAIGLGWIAAVSRPTSPTRRSSGRSSSRGSAWACSSLPSPTSSSAPSRSRDEGKASGASNAIREVGGVFGVAVLASIFASTGGYESPAVFNEGLVAAIWVGAVVVGLGALIALLVPGSSGPTRGSGRSRRPRTAVQDVSWGQSLGHVRSGAAAARRR